MELLYGKMEISIVTVTEEVSLRKPEMKKIKMNLVAIVNIRY